MRSIKPGRGPSKMDAFASFAAALFGIFWLLAAIRIGATVMVPFGLIFVGVALYGAFYSLKNATSKERYSIVDIVDEGEEGDPLNDRYGKKTIYCQNCGNKVSRDYKYCPKCGSRLVK